MYCWSMKVQVKFVLDEGLLARLDERALSAGHTRSRMAALLIERELANGTVPGLSGTSGAGRSVTPGPSKGLTVPLAKQPAVIAALRDAIGVKEADGPAPWETGNDPLGQPEIQRPHIFTAQSGIYCARDGCRKDLGARRKNPECAGRDVEEGAS